MELIPKMISTKDLLYLSDLFEINYLAFKEVSSYIKMIQDKEIKDTLERMKNLHEDHLHYIISILKQEDEEEYECESCEYDEDDEIEVDDDMDEEEKDEIEGDEDE
jgi:conserved hypothetical protein